MSDVVVVGGGHNGLVAATRLARAGRSVLLLEGRDAVGGLCSELEFHPGYRVPGVLHDTSTFRPEIASALELERFGLAWRDQEATRLALGREGAGLALPADPASAGELASSDREALVEWRSFLGRIRSLVARALLAPPPTLAPTSVPDFWNLARRGLSLRALGKQDLLELMRVTPMCLADWLRERFENPLLVESLAAPALLGGWLGPWAAGTATNLLCLECTSGRSIAGGPRALVAALQAAARAAGVEIRTSSRVAEVRVRAGRVVGVRLQDGEELEAAAVVASCDPKQALLELVDPRWLPLRVAEEISHFRSRGTTALVCLALSAPLEIAGREGSSFETLSVGGGHVDELEKAFDAVKYGRCSARPHLLVSVPTVADPSLAPDGHHVVSVLAQCAPFDRRGGWSDEARDAFGDTVVERLAEQVPDLRDRLVARHVATPVDLARDFSLPQGHLQHGEQSLDQLLMLRPSLATSAYGTPVQGLFLASSGCHPGGGVTGAPGWLGAGALLA